MGKIVVGIIFLLIIVVISFQIYKEKNIVKYQKKTTGKIIEYDNAYQANGIIYEYYVNNVRYTGQVGTSKFYCDDGTKCCIGHQFTVYYSSKHPQYSRIDLGKYEKYKTTVEFIK